MEPGSKRAFYLGRYNCVECLGGGLLGETWRAKVYGVAGFEKQFAVKRLHPHLCQDEGFVAAFVAAANAYASLEHERIARVHELNVQGAQYYVASDLIRGIDLARLLEALTERGEALSPDGAMLITLEVADALAYAHARKDLLPDGVAHLGLTPRSVMVTYEGDIRVLDVGLAAPLIRPGWGTAKKIGADAHYLAPEVLQGRRDDSRSDIYSLGVLLYQALAGRVPFEGANLDRLTSPIAPPDPPRCDPRLQVLLGQALQSDPAHRLPSAAAWREQLVPILGSRANRARADLSAALRRVARPDRKTGAFPVVAPLTMPPPPPPVPPRSEWAPPSGAVTRKEFPAPRGPQLSSLPTRNTLAGLGADDAAILPLELVELPGTPTDPEMAAVGSQVDEGWKSSLADGGRPETVRSVQHGGAGSEDSVEHDELDVSNREVSTAQTPSKAAVEATELRTNGAGLYSELADTTATGSRFTRTIPGQPIPADPRRFPSLAAEDARTEATESDERAQTLPAAEPLRVDATAVAPRFDTALDGAPAEKPGAGGTMHHIDSTAGASNSAGNSKGPIANRSASNTQVEAEAPRSAPPRAADSTVRGSASASCDGSNGAATATPSVVTRESSVKPAGSYVPPPIALPSPPTSRPWLMLVVVGTLAAISVSAVLAISTRRTTPEEQTSSAPVAATPVVPSGPGPSVPPAPSAAAGREEGAATTTATSPSSRTVGAGAAMGSHLANPPASQASPRPETKGNPIQGSPGMPVPRTSEERLGRDSRVAPTAPIAPSGSAAAGSDVDIATTPAGASIYVDGEPRGSAPLRLRLSPGSHRVVALLDGVRLRRETVHVTQGLTQVNLMLDPPALSADVAGPSGLKVRCSKTHGELRILIDGEDTGRQCPNEERISVKPGLHRIGLYSPRTDETVEVEKEVADDGNHSTRIYLKF
jgi:serine/threonine protein kinase